MAAAIRSTLASARTPAARAESSGALATSSAVAVASGTGIVDAAVAGLNRLAGAGTLPGYAGTLYLTSRRLIHLGQVTFAVPLTQIEEVSIVGERLLLTLSSGEGVSFDVSEPRLLRVMIGVARKTATR